jgi:hypothetical protein
VPRAFRELDAHLPEAGLPKPDRYHAPVPGFAEETFPLT